MKLISSLRAERSIAQFLAESDANAPAAKKAAESLRKLGNAAIPNLIDALAAADKQQTNVLIATLASHLSDATFGQFAAGLGHADKRCLAGVAWVLSKSSSYNPNQLVDLLGDEGVSKPTVIEVLRTKKDQVNVNQLLRRAYELDPREKAAVFKIIREVATEATVPDLLSRLEGKDPAIRVHIVSVLSRFNRPDVARALESQLSDSHKVVRQAALIALGGMDGERDVGRICKLLTDPDMEVQNRAVDLLVKSRHPNTMMHLVDVLKGQESHGCRSRTYSRRK
jgi:serine/threonine-protein kinase